MDLTSWQELHALDRYSETSIITRNQRSNQSPFNQYCIYYPADYRTPRKRSPQNLSLVPSATIPAIQTTSISLSALFDRQTPGKLVIVIGNIGRRKRYCLPKVAYKLYWTICGCGRISQDLHTVAYLGFQKGGPNFRWPLVLTPSFQFLYNVKKKIFFWSIWPRGKYATACTLTISHNSETKLY